MQGSGEGARRVTRITERSYFTAASPSEEVPGAGSYLAEIYLPGKFSTEVIPTKEIRERRALLETRQKLVGRRVAPQNRIRAVFVSQGTAAPRAAKAWTRLGLEGMAQHARPLAD